MQAIVTKYIPPANVRGSRVKAACQAGSVTLNWDHRLNPPDNHTAAAKALATKLGWNYGEWIGGDLPDGRSVYVCNDDKRMFPEDRFRVEQAADDGPGVRNAAGQGVVP